MVSSLIQNTVSHLQQTWSQKKLIRSGSIQSNSTQAQRYKFPFDSDYKELQSGSVDLSTRESLVINQTSIVLNIERI